MKRVLWLASWYPNKMEPQTGDFVNRHAIATSGFHPLNLVFVTKDLLPDQPDIKRVATDSNIHEYICYYAASRSAFGFISKLYSLRQYFNQHLIIIKELRKKREMPSIVHVHIAWRAGLIALYLKLRYGIPYVITEHWTGYFEESPHAIQKKGFLFRLLLKQIFRNADVFLPVTQNLAELVNRTIASIPVKVVPNVVDISLFNTDNHVEPKRFRFIHVSSILKQKNPDGILRAFGQLIKSGTDAELQMVGPLNEEFRQVLSENDYLKDRLIISGELSYGEVAVEIKNASAFVLFSQIENLPCVILESLCCGIPVIATRVGGISEVVGSKNGVLIEPGNEAMLVYAMQQMVREYNMYDKPGISRKACALFNYQTVGTEYVKIYKQVLGKNSQQF